jgi:ADP-ribosylglycohydrolase
VPPALIAFLAANDYEDAVRKAVSLGGDSDTIACMAGAVAGAFFRKIPEAITQQVWRRLDSRLAGVVRAFMQRYPSE